MLFRENEECIRTTTEKKIRLSENGKIAVIKNCDGSTFHCVRFDGCIVKGQLACDFVIEREVCGRVLVVELKGSDVSHAMKQAIATATYLKNEAKKNITIACIVICSHVPAADTRWQRLARQFTKVFGGPAKPYSARRLEICFAKAFFP